MISRNSGIGTKENPINAKALAEERVPLEAAYYSRYPVYCPEKGNPPDDLRTPEKRPRRSLH